MDGLAFVQMIESELKKRGIPKEQFYKESGISSATMSQWRKRIYSPSSAAIKKIEDYFGIAFTIEQKEKAPADDGKRIVEESLSKNANILKIARRDGSYIEEHVTDQELDAILAIMRLTRDASGDL